MVDTGGLRHGSLLIIDSDEYFAVRISRELERRGFKVHHARNAEDGITTAFRIRPDYALIELRLSDGSGLDIVKKIKDRIPFCRIVILTAFGNIATAVASVKAGALDYLAKPADIESIEYALLQGRNAPLPPPPAYPMPADRVRWEHIHRIYEQCGRNVSETARRLKMHRRTLQRILAKHAPQEHEPEPVKDRVTND